MIEKLPFEITQGEYEGKKFDIKSHTSPYDMQIKINELVDAVNALVYESDKDSDWYDGQTPAENVQEDTESGRGKVQDPVCFISTTYSSDNKTTVFLGQKGASVEFNQPLPAGFIITIKEN